MGQERLCSRLGTRRRNQAWQRLCRVTGREKGPRPSPAEPAPVQGTWPLGPLASACT